MTNTEQVLLIMVSWQYFPKSSDASEFLKQVINCFEKVETNISSKNHTLGSNDVLAYVRPHLELIGYDVEKGKKSNQRITIPVLFGLNGRVEKSFDVDAYHNKLQTVLEIEAGRAVTNYQFLKDFFEACVMYNVEYLILAIREIYGKKRSKDFKKVLMFFDTLFASNRMTIPLKGMLIIGY